MPDSAALFSWNKHPFMRPSNARFGGDVAGRVMMIQQGARRNYIYGRQLEAAGLLHSLVTDAAWPDGRLSAATQVLITALPRLKGPVMRRSVKGVSPQRLRASILPNLTGVVGRWLHEERRFALMDEALALRCRFRGLGSADVVINYHGNGGSFLNYAKTHGARIVTDFVTTPKYLEIEQKERERWPGWEAHTTSERVIANYWKRMSWLVTVSDLYLCPSMTVARDLADLPGFDAGRIRMVPYGSSGVLIRQPRTAPGRVLFAGKARLLKGLPYLAMAAKILKRRRPEIEIVVAGAASALVRNRPETRSLTFLGILDRDRMADEFARADLFCLPSLAEGSASSIFEAMANGLPVVTTSSSGSVVTDGEDGMIVPERDEGALADAIQRIVQMRELRTRLSQAVHATAALYSDEACGQRFISVIREFAASPTGDDRIGV
jgi:glycosyltransferase involved in cell wall biosynthesis